MLTSETSRLKTSFYKKNQVRKESNFSIFASSVLIRLSENQLIFQRSKNYPSKRVPDAIKEGQRVFLKFQIEQYSCQKSPDDETFQFGVLLPLPLRLSTPPPPPCSTEETILYAVREFPMNPYSSSNSHAQRESIPSKNMPTKIHSTAFDPG